LALVFLAPMYWTFISSVKGKSEIYASPPALFPHTFTWENYSKLFTAQGGAYLGCFLHSVVIDLSTVLLVTVICVLAGFAFSKLEVLGKRLWMTLILFTIMVPFQALMVPLYNTMSGLKLLNSLFCVVLIYATYQSPFCVYMMKDTFDMIPNALKEAAYIDGAGSLTIFFKVYLPLAMPGLVTVIVYTAYTTWNDYLIALTFGGTAWKTFNVAIADLANMSDVLDWGMMTSGSIVSLVPIMVLFLFLQKYFVKGMMSGAVK
jgi:multiple sugar transport system permease protein